VQARVDHKNGTVHFGGLELESDQLRDHISSLAQRLTKAVAVIYPSKDPQGEAQRLQVPCSVNHFCVAVGAELVL